MKLEKFKLEDFFEKYEFKVKYLLCASDCESFTIGELLKLEENADSELQQHWLGYTESPGNPTLREEISKLYQNIDADDIVVFSGAEEGIFIFMNVYLNAGDHVIVQEPAYQSLFEVANSLGCEITKWSMDYEQDWELDIEFLENCIKKNTKCLILNFPHSPTGYLPSKKKFNEIVKIAKEKNITIFSDEVYRFLELDPDDTLPAMCDVYSKGISLGVMSKSFGLAGLRIGWIASRERELLRSLLSLKNYTTICNSAPSEFLAMLALRNKKSILERNKELIKSNVKLLENFFNEYDYLFSWVKPKGGSVAFPRLLIQDDVDQFCQDLLEVEGVLLMPGSIFNYNKPHFRIGFGRKNMAEALLQFEEYIKRKY
jgi:aspartate/methionine/tyrosine aminotransferase